MSGVVARFYVQGYAKKAFNPDAVEITLQAVSRGEANKVWASATPSGSITMMIRNGPAGDFFVDCFERKAEVEIHFREAPKEE
jgi:hypothetical protein